MSRADLGDDGDGEHEGDAGENPPADAQRPAARRPDWHGSWGPVIPSASVPHDPRIWPGAATASASSTAIRSNMAIAAVGFQRIVRGIYDVGERADGERRAPSTCPTGLPRVIPIGDCANSMTACRPFGKTDLLSDTLWP
jgi:hypothetical protein